MKIINYISVATMPVLILIIVASSFLEKNKVFDNFIDGAKDGMKIVCNLFPTLVGLFLAIGALRSSGILDLIINFISPLTSKLNIPKEILPLAFLRPISGSGATAIGTDIMTQYGVDSRIGLIASTIMGSTETTLYIIAIYTSCVKIKKTRGILLAALVADLVGIFVSIIIWNIILKN